MSPLPQKKVRTTAVRTLRSLEGDSSGKAEEPIPKTSMAHAMLIHTIIGSTPILNECQKGDR